MGFRFLNPIIKFKPQNFNFYKFADFFLRIHCFAKTNANIANPMPKLIVSFAMKEKYFSQIFGTTINGVTASNKTRSTALHLATNQPCKADEKANIPKSAVTKITQI